MLGGVMSDIGPHCVAPSPASPPPELSPPPCWLVPTQTQPHQSQATGGPALGIMRSQPRAISENLPSINAPEKERERERGGKRESGSRWEPISHPPRPCRRGPNLAAPACVRLSVGPSRPTLSLTHCVGRLKEGTLWAQWLPLLTLSLSLWWKGDTSVICFWQRRLSCFYFPLVFSNSKVTHKGNFFRISKFHNQ